MRRVVVLALVLVVFMFATAIATATISTPKINTLDRTLSIKNIFPLGDEFPGGPPKPRSGTGS